LKILRIIIRLGIPILTKIGKFIAFYIITILLDFDVAQGQSPDDAGDDDSARGQNDDVAEGQDDDVAMEEESNVQTGSPDHRGSPDSQNTGYETNPDREFLEEGADAMLYYPARDLPNDQLERYRADLRDMREDMVDEMDDATKQEVDDRIRALDNEATRRGIITGEHNNSNSSNSNSDNSDNSNN
jgi:hypothetical protein